MIKMDSLYYITWGEQWSPVLRGQAGHVVDLLQELRPALDIHLVAGVSLRQFFSNRSAIKADAATAMVMPVFPGNRNWKKNVPLLGAWLRIKRPRALICRGPISTSLMLKARDVCRVDCMICYDGRGARSAEIEEYSPGDPLALEMPEIEKRAVLGADWRIAVSDHLVKHWKERFAYSLDAHTVIPCSLARQFEGDVDYNAQTVRENLGWNQDDVVLVHSGGGAGWQHGNETFQILRAWLRLHDKLRLLILSNASAEYDELQVEFPGKVVVTQVPHHEVPELLSACDYGLLIREATITNQVASPVKFAEYLACGLKVLISSELGDFSAMVGEHQLGHIVGFGNADGVQLEKISPEEKVRIRGYGLARFSKSEAFIREGYSAVVGALLD